MKDREFLNNITTGRYIKLGVAGSWEAKCIDDGTLRLGYYEVPHEMALKGDKSLITTLFLNDNVAKSSSSNHARQVYNFYSSGNETIWITFSKGSLWWTVTDQPVEFLGSNQSEHPYGSRLRRTTMGWSDESLSGKKLNMSDLDGKLTSVSAYRQTTCDLDQRCLAYLLRRIKDEAFPEVISVQNSLKSLTHGVQTLIERLSWKDFELFVELLFTRSEYKRISAIGQTQKAIDLELVSLLTGERIVVQIKSRSNQNQLDNYISEFEGMSATRMFYVYHSSDYTLSTSSDDVQIMGPEVLATLAVKLGMVDWLIERIS